MSDAAPLPGTVSGPAASPATRHPRPGMPKKAPAIMHAQRLDAFDVTTRRSFVDPASRSRLLPRLVILGGAFVITAIAVVEMIRSLALGGLTPIEAVIIVLFTLNVGWISLTFVSALAGAIIVLMRRVLPTGGTPLSGRTAVLMPTYNESPERVFSALEAMAAGVDELGEGEAFDWFVLSDTTHPTIALEEEEALTEMRSRLGKNVNVYYRRRRRNVARKAGNIADFCRRWGGAYDYLLTLDADSLMEPDSIIALTRRMEADPDSGLIQTIPRLVHGRTAFARLQQFAGRVYGPVIATGLAWWTQSEGNYWGHNAIIRRRAFTEAAGLPDLPGRPPFGSHIMSHDFVEAALIRRAGWSVKIAADIDGSYEETPPSMLDFAARDRRWCQGNLQHARIVSAAGLNWVSRYHLVSGIFSYAASLLWLLLIVAGMALAVQASFTPPNYFDDPYQLFPTWPRLDSALQIELLAVTLFLLVGPKIFGLAATILKGDERRKSGGARRLIASFFTELFISALMAPIMMVIQSTVIVSILAGADAGWAAQRREHGKFTLAEAVRVHRWHAIAGIVLALAAWWVEPMLVAWLGLVIAGLVLSGPISAMTASVRAGRVLRKLGLLITPEERARPTIGRTTSTMRPLHRATVSATPDMHGLVSDDWRRRVHLALVDAPEEASGVADVDPVEAVAAAKIGRARSLEEALTHLRPDEQAMTLARPSLFASLSSLPGSNANDDTPERQRPPAA